jgi:hypothetical protein
MSATRGAPAFANALAVARPMPDDPPVIKTVHSSIFLCLAIVSEIPSLHGDRFGSIAQNELLDLARRSPWHLRETLEVVQASRISARPRKQDTRSVPARPSISTIGIFSPPRMALFCADRSSALIGALWYFAYVSTIAAGVRMAKCASGRCRVSAAPCRAQPMCQRSAPVSRSSSCTAGCHGPAGRTCRTRLW